MLREGFRIRSRALEWTKKAALQNKNLVDLGNEAAHHGRAAADASLYTSTFPWEKRTDTETFKGIYGFEPSFINQNKGYGHFLDVLDWQGTVNQYPSGISRNAFITLFQDVVLGVVNSKKFKIEDMKEWKKHFEGECSCADCSKDTTEKKKTRYEHLESRYQTALAYRKSELARKRNS